MPARILIVDDNASLAANLRDVLEGARELDVEVVLAESGGRGLEAAQRGGFDVAVVDVKLPDASGVDLIRPLRAASPHGEIVLVTGFATVDTAIGALQAGAFAFVLKSFRPEELISTVAQALEKIALKREREDIELRYRALVDAADVLIVGLDGAGLVTLFNARMTELTGDASAIGKPFADTFVDEGDHKRLALAIQSVGEGQGPAKEVNLGIRDTVGALRRVRFHLSAVRADHGAAATATLDDAETGPWRGPIYGIGVDVTERRALERRAAAAEALNAMAPLALGLAHEIRNPLNAAVLELHLLGRGIDRLPDESVRAPMRRRVDIVESEIKRLERLLTDFLELARPRAPQREPIELSRVLGDVLDLEEEAIAAHHIRVEKALAPDCFALGDVEKLKQVALNLVVNAIDVMPEGGVLGGEVGGDAHEVWLAVADSGPGVDPTILAEIFDPFFTTKAAGTGLGLPIVRKIVEQHGGRVVVDTERGKGAVVRVILPRFHPPPHA